MLASSSSSRGSPSSPGIHAHLDSGELSGAHDGTGDDESRELLHLSNLWNLMKVYDLVHEDLEPDTTTETSIQIFQYLLAHLLHFVTEAVHRAIIIKEQELQMKAGLKIWKVPPNPLIRLPSVRHALNMMDMGETRIRDYLERFTDAMKRCEGYEGSDEPQNRVPQHE